MARGDITGDAEYKLPAYHSGHLEVIKRMKKRNLICAHRGWRKSTFAIRQMFAHLLTGQDAGMYAQNYSPIYSNFREMKITGIPEEWIHKSAPITFSIPNKGTLYCYSMDNGDTARGPTYPLVLVEEAGTLARGHRESVIYPVFKKCGGVLIETGTPDPADPYNEFYDEIHKAKKFPNRISSFVIPALGATYNNETGELEFPSTPDPLSSPVPFPEADSDYESQKDFMREDFQMATNKNRWRIEWLCEFLTDEGSQYENIDQVCCINPVNIVTNGVSEWWHKDYIGKDCSKIWCSVGIDVGTLQDYTVITAMDRTTMEQIYFRRFKPNGGNKWIQVDTAVQRAIELFGMPNIDATGAGTRYRDWTSVNPITFTGTNKPQIHDHMASLMSGMKVKFFRHTGGDGEIMYELTKMQRRLNENTGHIIIKGAKNEHDDICTSLSLMLLNVTPTYIQENPSDIIKLVSNIPDFMTVQW